MLTFKRPLNTELKSGSLGAPSREFLVAKWRTHPSLSHLLKPNLVPRNGPVKRLVQYSTWFALFVWFLSFYEYAFDMFGYKVPLVIGLAALISLTISKIAGVRSAPRDYSELASDPISGEFRVTAQFRMVGFEYGQDVGLLSLEDGWLFFQGQNTTFSLGFGDFSYEALQGGSVRISLGPLGIPVDIRLWNSDETGPNLFTTIQDWALRSDAPEGVAVLPPLGTLDPWSITCIRSDSAASIAVLLGFVGMYLGFVWAPDRYFPIAPFLIPIVLIGLALAGYWLCFLLVNKLGVRRLAKLNAVTSVKPH